MEYVVYVVKCESEKYWVGFTARELDFYLERMKDGKGPMFTREYAPLTIIPICETDNIENAEKLNVTVFNILSRILGSCNVQMDSKRYQKVCGLNSVPNIEELFSTGENISFAPYDESESTLKNGKNGKYIVYSLLCNKNARYIGMTTNLLKTMKSHKGGRMGDFTKAYKPKELEYKLYYDDEISAKMGQIELLDTIRGEEGYYTKIYTEFINSKPDQRIVWEDIIPPANEELFENTPDGPGIRYWVYVLGCAENKYYVGFTSDIRKRFKKHCSELGGANFTYEFVPYYVLHIEGHKNMRSAKKAEDDWTLDLKKLKGKENVFGFWEKSSEPDRKMYLAHELLDNWVIKNPRAYDLV